MNGEKETKPTLIVIFGITGDLARRKLLPALYHLMRDNLLHPDTQIIGVTRQKLSKTEALASLDKYAASHARPSPTALGRFEQAFHLLRANLSSVDGYKKLKKALDDTEKSAKLGFKRLYYLSIPPAVLDEVIDFMGQAGLQESYRGGELPSLLVEKPFGYDLSSARGLIRALHRHFDESQIYRIDHYLAKEMAQNVLNFRFDNPLFSRIWDNNHIARVEITAYEKIGIEGRTQFYEQTGALRDLIQSHLLLMMSLVAMKRPKRMTSASIHQARLQLLKSIKAPEPYEVDTVTRRGQYRTYRAETKRRQSMVETYAAVKLEVADQQWEGVPFLLKTGKAMDRKITKIELFFRDQAKENRLELRLQPDEAVELELHVKQPGHGHVRTDTVMDFRYQRSFSSLPAPEAYERVLLDAAIGDQTLFASSHEVLEAWRIVQPILDEWQKSPVGPQLYKNHPAKLPRNLQLL